MNNVNIKTDCKKLNHSTGLFTQKFSKPKSIID